MAGVVVLLGVPLSASAAMAVAAVAVVRTVTRRNVDYGRPGVVPVFGILVHGPDLLLVCLVLLTSGLAPAVVAALSGVALARAPG